MTNRAIRQILILSNGVFAISFTLLVLNIDVPATATHQTVMELIRDLQPEFIAFGVSVFVIGLIWRVHQNLFDEFSDLDGTLIWCNFVYLATVALIPFANQLFSQYQADPLSYVVFAVLLIVIFLLDSLMLSYAKHTALIRPTPRSDAHIRSELLRGFVSILVFTVSIPLAFVLVEWTPLIWIGSLLADEALIRIYRQS